MSDGWWMLAAEAMRQFGPSVKRRFASLMKFGSLDLPDIPAEAIIDWEQIRSLPSSKRITSLSTALFELEKFADLLPDDDRMEIPNLLLLLYAIQYKQMIQVVQIEDLSQRLSSIEGQIRKD